MRKCETDDQEGGKIKLVDHGKEDSRIMWSADHPQKAGQKCNEISEKQTRECKDGTFKEWGGERSFASAECSENCATPLYMGP